MPRTSEGLLAPPPCWRRRPLEEGEGAGKYSVRVVEQTVGHDGIGFLRPQVSVGRGCAEGSPQYRHEESPILGPTDRGRHSHPTRVSLAREAREFKAAWSLLRTVLPRDLANVDDLLGLVHTGAVSNCSRQSQSRVFQISLRLNVD